MVSLLDCSNILVPYCCKTCGLSTNEKIQYLFHSCESGDKSEVKYVEQLCDECPTICSYSTLWIFSHQIKHGYINNKLQYKKINTVSNIKRLSCDQRIHSLDSNHAHSDVIWYECEYCDWRSKYRGNLHYHIKSKHSMEKKRFQCNDCDYQSHKNIDLKTHIMRKHTPDHLINWHKCNQCLYQAKERAVLNQHITAVHTPEDQILWFNCNLCEYRTKRSSDVNRHLRSIHLKNGHWKKTPSRQYKCTKCTYEARSKSNLQNHITVRHTPDHLVKWFNCTICMFKAKRQSDLNSHLKSMHATDDANKFICRICNASYKLKRNLNSHMVSCHPTDMSCFDCGYKANNFLDLRQHLRDAHLRAEKAFNCEKCMFDTDFKGNLGQHFRVRHTLNQ